MDQENKSQPVNRPAAAPNDHSLDEFFNNFQSEMRRPDLSQEAISAAFQAIQHLALESDSEQTGAAGAKAAPGAMSSCPACHTHNPEGSRFCAACGVPLQMSASQGVQSAPAAMPGEHHYHHHYHHHYFAAGNGMAAPVAAEHKPVASAPARDPGRGARPGFTGTPLSRAESGARKVTQDWALACNTKQLDDLIDLYTADAIVLRSNFPPVRGTAAVREFFFTALDAGLGDAEFDPLRVELFGEIAYELGRCKILVPTAMGKRREERGKYMMLLSRQQTGDWRIIADCWSSDLSLGLTPEASSAPTASRTARK